MSLFQNLEWRHVARLMALILLVGSILYPSDMDGHYAHSRQGRDNAVVIGVEPYGRHLNSLIPIGAAIALRDVQGLWQISATIVVGTLATHLPKRILNNVEINGVRLGQRPNGGNHNMPSGHSALASAGALIAVRRYWNGFGLIVRLILCLTMFARYMLDAHTIAATIAGAVIGIPVADCFVSPRLKRDQIANWRKFTAAIAMVLPKRLGGNSRMTKL